jgi:hypothetical protein
MADAELLCPAVGCGARFHLRYDPRLVPFRGEPGDRPRGACPNGHAFSYARVFEDPRDEWLFTHFALDAE